jgi:DNA-binding PadR family transcriptional regulator
MSSSAASEVRSRSERGGRGAQVGLLQIGVLVALVDSMPIGAYSIVKALGSMFPETSVYNALPQLVEQGLVRSEVVDGVRGPKPAYSLTEAGQEAVQEWAKTPPARLLAPTTAMVLWLSTTRVRKPGEVLRSIEILAEALEEQELELKLQGKRTRRAEGWTTHAELEYELERGALEASRQLLALAKGRFEERVAALRTD